MKETGFATRTGRCRLLPAELRLERNRRAWFRLETLFGGRLHIRPVVQCAVGMALLMLAKGLLQPGLVTLSLLLLFFAFLYFASAVKNRNLSAADAIAAATINQIIDHPPFPTQRAYFTVHYDAAGGPRKRNITLQFAGEASELEYAQASRILHEWLRSVRAHAAGPYPARD